MIGASALFVFTLHGNNWEDLYDIILKKSIFSIWSSFYRGQFWIDVTIIGWMMINVAMNQIIVLFVMLSWVLIINFAIVGSIKPLGKHLMVKERESWVKILIKSGLYYWRSKINSRDTLIAGEAIYHGKQRMNVSN